MKSILSRLDVVNEKQMLEAIKAGYPVTVIINGEYYNYKPTNKRIISNKYEEVNHG